MRRIIVCSLFLSVFILGVATYAAIDTGTVRASNVTLKVVYGNGSDVVVESGREYWVYVWRIERGTPMLTQVAKGKAPSGIFNVYLSPGDFVATVQRTGVGEDTRHGYSYTKKPKDFHVDDSSKLFINVPLSCSNRITEAAGDINPMD